MYAVKFVIETYERSRNQRNQNRIKLRKKKKKKKHYANVYVALRFCDTKMSTA